MAALSEARAIEEIILWHQNVPTSSGSAQINNATTPSTSSAMSTSRHPTSTAFAPRASHSHMPTARARYARPVVPAFSPDFIPAPYTAIAMAMPISRQMNAYNSSPNASPMSDTTAAYRANSTSPLPGTAKNNALTMDIANSGIATHTIRASEMATSTPTGSPNRA